MENKETFESALLKLETTIKELESGDVDLDNSIQKYKESMELVKFCNEKLKNARETINKVMKDDGTLEDFENKN